MDMLKVVWAGWNNIFPSDKIWGILENNQGSYINFWCRRGASMQFKVVDNKKFQHKINGGYKEITYNQLNEFYPGFDEQVTEQFIFKILSGKVRGVDG